MTNGENNKTIEAIVALMLCVLSAHAGHPFDITDLAVNLNANLPSFELPENISGNVCNESTAFQIPVSCMDVALTDDHFQYDFDRQELRINLGSYTMDTVTNYKFADPNNETVHFCFPLTPQLLNCNLWKFGPDCYELNHHKLTIPSSNFSAELGDYFLDSDNNAFVCSESIRPAKHRPRCNNVQLEFGQYATNADGSIFINVTNTTIRNPQYKVNQVDNTVVVCYPLSIPFLNCQIESAMLLHNYLHDKKPELKIYFRSYRTTYSVDEYFSQSNNFEDFIVCAPENILVAIVLKHIYNTIKGVSCVLVTFVISHHLMAPKRTVHIKCLVSYYSSGVAFYILTIIPVMECYTSFVTIYLTSNAAVIWVNIISYDIWKSFTKLRKSPNQGSSKKKSNSYAHYCLLGWGAPVLLCVITLILDKYYRMKNKLFLSPLVGLNYNCFYHDKWVSFGLHYAIILILSLVNAVFFLLTVYAIHKGSLGTDIVNKRRKTQMYIVRFKLFILMGCVLVMEGITWCIQEHFEFQFWFIADAFISSQGFTIFCAETSKRGTIQLMINRFRLNFGKLSRKWNLSSVRSTSHTTSSQGGTSDTPINV